MQYEGKTALVTGASSGIGAEFAKELHSRGASVVLVARRREMLESLATELCAKREASASFHAIDISNPDGMRALIELVRSTRVDILVNNAGRGSFGHFESIPLEEELQMVSLNVAATVCAAHAVVPQMKERRAGAIIGISSIAGFQPLPYMATYAGTKAFNLTHTMALRHELKPFGVRVIAVCPGPVETEFAGVARVPGQFTNIRRDSVKDVVRDSLRALEKGKGIVVPGWRSRILGLATHLLPLDATTAVVERALRGSLPKDR